MHRIDRETAGLVLRVTTFEFEHHDRTETT